MKKFFFPVFLFLATFFFFACTKAQNTLKSGSVQATETPATSSSSNLSTNATDQNILAISSMRQKSYPGSDISIEQKLNSAANYNRYLISYISNGLKIFGLLTVPKGNKPTHGWPVIVFHHGYIPPASYQTVSSYAKYVDFFARHGYIVLKPDYRGNAQSQGKPVQPYISPDDTTDSLNAIASIKKYKDADPQNIGVWAHSMGGNIVLHDLVISKDIKAAVIWAGTVGSYDQLVRWWQQRIAAKILRGNDTDTAQIVMAILQQEGAPQQNPSFWNAIDPTFYLSDVQAPIQLHHEESDPIVPLEFSTSLKQKLDQNGKTVELYTYPGADHNFTAVFNTAMQRSVNFFDAYLKK